MMIAGAHQRVVLERHGLLDQVAGHDQQHQLERVELRQLPLAHAAQDEPEERVDDRGADDDVHQRLTGAPSS